MRVDKQFIMEEIIKPLEKEKKTKLPRTVLISYFLNRNNYDGTGKVTDTYKYEAEVLYEAYDFNMIRGFRTDEIGEEYIGKNLGSNSKLIFNSGLNEVEIMNKAIDTIESYFIELEEKSKKNMTYYPCDDDEMAMS